ncbi:Uncharacterised protein [Pseudomonas putida]|nr:Uncharacterised protein [Pseudomonas putida]
MRLGQRGQREVRRRHALVPRIAAVLDQLCQGLPVGLGQLLDGGRVMNVGAVGPLQEQLAAVHLAGDAQPVAQLRAGTLGTACAFPTRGEQGAGLGIEAGIELAQVVEGDTSLGGTLELVTHFSIAEVTQQAVAEAFVRHAAQLFLDRLDRLAKVLAGCETHREQAGEPAHGAAEVEVVEQVFAAMALQQYLHVVLCAPLAQGARQRGQQQVVDLRAVGRRGLFQQFGGALGIQPCGGGTGMGVGQAAQRVVTRQFGVVAGQRLQPVVALCLQCGAAGMAGQALGPGLHRGGLGGQAHGLAVQQLPVGRLQVFQQHPPRHTVDHQVMDHQQQALLAIGEIEQFGTQQRPVLQVQAGLHLVAGGVQFTQCCQVALVQQWRIVQRLEARLPLAFATAEAQAQGIMLLDHGAQGCLQVLHLHRAGRLEQHRLVPMRRLGDLHLEETRLGRQQCQLAAGGGVHGCGRNRLLGLDALGYLGQLGDGLLFEQLLGGDPDALAFGPGDDLQAEDRVAAQFEEVVGAADLLQLEHIGPHCSQLLLDIALRRHIATADRARCQQGALVELAIGGQWQALQQQYVRRHHVVRQACLQLRLQLLHGHACIGHPVGHQLQALGIALQWQGQYHGLVDTRQAGQHPADFTWLHAIAADLHLVVGTADELDQAIGSQPRAVAGAVQAGTTLGRHEAFGGQCGLAQVALSDTLPAQVKLTGHLRRQRVEVAIQHLGAGVAQRAPDRHRAATWQRLPRLEGEHADSGFGRAVVVDDPAGRAQFADFFQQAPAACLTTQDQCLGGQHIGGAGRLQQALQVARHQFEHADLVLRHVAGEAIRVERQFLWQQVQQAARGQGTEQHGVAQVGRGGGHHRHARRGRQLQALQHRLGVAGQRPVADHHAFRLAGRARGVDQIGRLLGGNGHLDRAVAAGCPGGVIAGNPLHAVQAGEALVARLMQQYGGATVGNQLLQALLRLLGVQRQVGGAGLEHREQGADPLDGARQAQGDDAASTDAVLAQVVGQAVGRRLQPGLGHEPVTGTHTAVGLALRHCLAPQSEEVAVRVGLRGRRQQRRQLRAVDDRLLRVADQRIQHLAQRSGHAFDGGLLEQVVGVGEIAFDAVGLVREVERQVEAGIAAVTGKAFHLQRAQALAPCIAGGHVLVDLELEQRVVGQVALGQQGIDQVLERQLLVRLGAADHVFYLLQQCGEGGALVHLHAQHLGVDEEADQAFQLLAVAPGVRGADADVGLAAVARQHHRHGRQYQHEQRVATLARLAAQGLGLFGADVHTHHRATLAGRGRALEVQRQAQHRLLAAQLGLPVGQLALRFTCLEPGALPDGVVGVLDRQGRQLGLPAFGQGAVQLDEFLHQHIAGPAVGDDVVHAQRQHVVIGGHAQQGHPQQRATQQVEGLLEGGVHGHAQRCLIDGTVEHQQFQRQRAVLEDFLVELALLRGKARAQRFVALHQRIQRLLQHCLVQRALQAYRHRHVVGWAVGLQLPEKQQALLGVRQRNTRQALARGHDGQQAEALAGGLHLFQDLLALLHREANETLGDTLCGSEFHVRPL